MLFLPVLHNDLGDFFLTHARRRRHCHRHPLREPQVRFLPSKNMVVGPINVPATGFMTGGYAYSSLRCTGVEPYAWAEYAANYSTEVWHVCLVFCHTGLLPWSLSVVFCRSGLLLWHICLVFCRTGLLLCSFSVVFGHTGLLLWRISVRAWLPMV